MFYIGSKRIQAEPQDRDGECGYKVIHPGGYESWSPKAVFESAYLPMGEDSDGTKINESMVEDFITDYHVSTHHDKITIVIAVLRNGFTIVESSACVDPANYSEEMGAEICKERIKNQVWHNLGFLLQSASEGLKPCS